MLLTLRTDNEFDFRYNIQLRFVEKMVGMHGSSRLRFFSHERFFRAIKHIISSIMVNSKNVPQIVEVITVSVSKMNFRGAHTYSSLLVSKLYSFISKMFSFKNNRRSSTAGQQSPYHQRIAELFITSTNYKQKLN